MEKNTLRTEYLLRRKIEKKINRDEEIELALLLKENSEEENERALEQVWNAFNPTASISPEKAGLILNKILQRKTYTPGRRMFVLRRLKYISIAASLLLIIGATLFLSTRKRLAPETFTAKTYVKPTKATKVKYIRYITLADGSKVVLNAGSTIHILSDFNRRTREIRLLGEAYFDIVHDKNRPFIIHTGTVKTTVLGTAFNIKAWPNEHNIVVSVTRGKVKVEDKNQVLAVLTSNKQISYNEVISRKSEKKVDAGKLVTDWTKEDMTFDGATLQTIVQSLSRRYGIPVRVPDQQLANKQIVLSFKGTEPLDSILDIICTINENTKHITKDGSIEIISTDK